MCRIFSTAERWTRKSWRSKQVYIPCPRCGRSHHHALGQKVWEYFRDHPDDNEAFNRGLAEIRSD
jgi:hypothetical protein